MTDVGDNTTDPRTEGIVKKLIVILALVSAVIAAPSQAAKPPKAPKPAPPAGSHKCQPHAISYEVAGTLVSGSLTLNSDGTYSGSLTVHVTSANKHAKIDKNTNKAYTIANARVNLHGANPAALAAGSRVKLEGKVTTLARKCNQTGFTAGITIAHGDISAPKPH
jgi:hypothetical protein